MEQIKLPIKIKIAIRLMDIIAIIMLLPTVFFFYAFFFGLSAASEPGHFSSLILGIICFLLLLTFIISGVLITKRRKMGWWLAVVSICLFVFLASLGLLLYGPSLISLLPLTVGALIVLVFLLFDRKKFFEITN